MALRRLRAALKMFRRELPFPQFDALQDDARRIASAFGPARECDVLLKSAGEGPLAHSDRPDGYETWLASVEERRAAAYGNIRALIEDVHTTRFVLDVRNLLVRCAWRNELASIELAELNGPIAVFARKALERLHKRALERGKHLAKLPDKERHKLRITLKNLRYCAEFFGALFGSRRKIRRYIGTLSALQDLLGAHNDAVSARQFLDEMPPRVERTSGFVLGWFAGESLLAEAELRAAWHKFKKADVFWR